MKLTPYRFGTVNLIFAEFKSTLLRRWVVDEFQRFKQAAILVIYILDCIFTHQIIRGKVVLTTVDVTLSGET